jgi:hypothetical protein
VIAAHKLDEQRRREEAEAAKAREFRARGVPTHEPFAPAPSAQALCSPRPFQLRSEARGAIAQIHFDALVRAEEEARTSGAQFKAGKCTVTKEQPFQVHKSTKPLTELQVRPRAVRRARRACTGSEGSLPRGRVCTQRG